MGADRIETTSSILLLTEAWAVDSSCITSVVNSEPLTAEFFRYECELIWNKILYLYYMNVPTCTTCNSKYNWGA